MSTPADTQASRPRITVVICTYNRAEHLGRCLQSLIEQTLPAHDFEIIVVDDGSTDCTPAACDRFTHRPGLRVIRQANAGLGAARERGWRAGSAPIVAFLDDDAEAPPDWLALATKRLDAWSTRPRPPAVLGGPTRGRWETPRPPWLDENLAVYLTIWQPYSAYRESDQETLFVGANMFFSRSALEAVGGFDSRLGRRGSNLLSHEESELWTRLRAAGHLAAHDPAIWVWHHVPAERCRPAWFIRRIYWEGVSIARHLRPTPDYPHPLTSARLVLGALLKPPTRRGWELDWRLNLAFQLGRASELLRFARPAA